MTDIPRWALGDSSSILIKWCKSSGAWFLFQIIPLHGFRSLSNLLSCLTAVLYQKDLSNYRSVLFCFMISIFVISATVSSAGPHPDIHIHTYHKNTASYLPKGKPVFVFSLSHCLSIHPDLCNPCMLCVFVSVCPFVLLLHLCLMWAHLECTIFHCKGIHLPCVFRHKRLEIL